MNLYAFLLLIRLCQFNFQGPAKEPYEAGVIICLPFRIFLTFLCHFHFLGYFTVFFQTLFKVVLESIFTWALLNSFFVSGIFFFFHFFLEFNQFLFKLSWFLSILHFWIRVIFHILKYLSVFNSVWSVNLHFSFTSLLFCRGVFLNWPL